MATAVRLLVLGCMLHSCCHALMIKRALVPSTAKPGYIVTSLTYWGQQFSVESSSRKDISRYFTVSTHGDLITSSDISDLVGSKLSLVVNNFLASEKWQEAVHVDIQDGNQLLVFSHNDNSYHGFILENKPAGSAVRGLEDIYAVLRNEPYKKVVYSLSATGNQRQNAFALKEKVVNEVHHVQIVTSKPLDREQKDKYILTIRAESDDNTEEPVHARVTILIGDENDNIPRFEKSSYFTTISDDFPALATVVHVKAVDPDDGKIKYIMHPHELFKIDPQKGNIILKSRKHLDGQSYELLVYAEDQSGQQSEPVTVLIEVENIHKKGSPLLFQPLDHESHQQHQQHSHSRKKRDTIVLPTKEFEVPESMVGVLIRLSENENYERFAFQRPAPLKLEINRYNGAVQLKDNERLDYEKQEDLNFTVIITRKDQSIVQQPVKIKLTDVNDESPQFVNVPRPFLATVSQNAPPGTSVYQLMARDDDKDSTVNYNLESGGEDRFEVDTESGVVRTKGNQPFRQGKEYEIGVSASDVAANSPQRSPTQSLKILVGERDPQFYEAMYVASVPELAHEQYEIIEVKAYSHQGYPITYELTSESGSQSNEFAIDSSTGVVDLLRRLDYEKDPQQYHLRVRSIENGRPPRYSSVHLIINLVDMNDNRPTFPLSQYIVQGISETVPNGTHIIQVTATDLDSVTNSQLTYSVSDANFTVESLNNIGYIKTARSLDYDHIPDHTYNFTIVATDNGSPANSGSAQVRVTVTNVNDEDPEFFQAVEHVQVSEDASPNTVVHVIQAYDPDGDEVTYSFTGDKLVNGPFRIDPNSGILTLEGQMDKSKVVYKLNITATDNGRCCGRKMSRSSRGLVIVEVKDINNNAPRFPECGNYHPSVAEGEDVGTSVIQVTAVDLDTGANGNVTYSLIKSIDQDSDRFTIEPISGIVRTAEVFNREARTGVSATDYGVTVKAEDQGSPSLAGFCTFRVRIDDKNDNPPVFDFPSYLTSIEESSPIGKRVLQVYASDKDTRDNGQIEYIMKSDDSGFFEVNRHTGWITVKTAMSGKKQANLVIEARDQGVPSMSRIVEVQIDITQTVNAYPQWVEDYSARPIQLPENVPVNYLVKRLKAYSNMPDATVNYVIQPGETPEQNGAPRSFHTRIDESSNEMLLYVYRALDFETIPKYTLTIRASNRATNSLRNDTRITIELIDKNDEIPQFVGLDEYGRYSGSVAENLPQGAQVITITATDRDEFRDYRQIRYSIKPYGLDHDKFAIDSDTGLVTTRETFDREEKDEYYLTVVAEDGAKSDRPNHQPPGTANQGEAEIQIRITDKNDNPPFFKHRSYNASLPENTDTGAIIITVTAEDEDEENQMSYSITGGNVGNAFEVVPDLGQIKVRGKLDYEKGPRIDGRVEYRLTYRVFDEKFANSATVVIKISDVNDNAPQFERSVYEVMDVIEEDPDVSENNPKFLIRVRAEDPDIDRQSNIRYGLTGQFSVNGYFKINEITGDIYVTKKLDRDKPYGRNIWNFNVLAHDEPGSGQSLTGYAVVQVFPQDINDNAPVFDNNRLVGSVPEHSRAGVLVLTVIATDADKGNNGTVTYSLKQVPVKDGQALFNIHPNTGLITTTMSNALDREVQESYLIIVQAKDQGTPDAQSSSATVTINVDDINDHAPRFTQKVYQTTMSENYPVGRSITSVSATDRDMGTNAKMTYTLKERDRENFFMSSVMATNTGVLKVFKPVDYDTLVNPFFNLTVYVQDTDSTHQDVAYIEVYVTDYNDNPPVFQPNTRKVPIDENVTRGTSLARFTATDKDTGMNRQFSYAVDLKTDPERQFAVDGTGLVTTAKLLDRETTPVHRIHILAIDKGIPPQTGTGTLIVSLNDINDNFPEFAEDYQPVIFENENKGQTVVTISAIDKDTATNGPPFEFWLPCRGGCPCAENPTCDDFAFNFIPGGGMNGRGSGIVTTKRSFNREERKYYYMPIIMRDSGKPMISGTNTLTITIGDRNDNKHSPGHKNIFVYNYKGEFTNAPLGNVYADDPDDWDVSDKEFSFFSGEAARFFSLGKETGDLTMKGGIREGDYTFQVNVYDREWKRNVVSSVTVKVREINDDAVFNSGSVRLTDITAEEFVHRQKRGPGIQEYGKSKYDMFQTMIAEKLRVPVGNVHVFTVMNHPTLPRTTDVRFAAHGSPYYRSARLDGLVNQNKDQFEADLGIKIAMVPIDECLKERCEAGGCANKLITTSDPLLVNTNGTSLIGVTAYIVAKCECAARSFSAISADVKCRPDSCYNGGTCHQRVYDIVCECAPGFDGPRCQQTHHSFTGNGWAWYKPLAQCEDSHTSLEFITRVRDGIILYNGPVRDLEAHEDQDFILLELRNGYPVLRINHGSGEAKLVIDGRDSRGQLRMHKLNDGRWHRIDIFREGKWVRLTVDECTTAVRHENENDQTSMEDRAPCEAEKQTPGANKYLNINTPLQLGGRSNAAVALPDNVLTQGLNGCVKNLMHNGELYDLHIGRVGEQENSEDGCPAEDIVCGLNDVEGPKCGLNGTCRGTFNRGEFQCVCNPGSRGTRCQSATAVKDFRERSFIEWDFKEKFYELLERRAHHNELQLMFRTRQDMGLLFKVQNMQKSEYMVLEIKEQKVRFRYNLGSGEEMVALSHVNVSDGQWHTVYVERIGKAATLKLDGGEGRFYNVSLGSNGGHLQIRVAKRQFYAGGDVKFPSSQAPAIVDYDFRDSCVNDIRFNGEWLPMDRQDNHLSEAAELKRWSGITDDCVSEACLAITCRLPLICTNLWRYAECRCPKGQVLVYTEEVCVNVDECQERPCVHGECIDQRNGFLCACDPGWTGQLCSAKEQAYVAYMSTGAIFAIVICVMVVLLLVLLFIVYSRRRRPNQLVVAMDPDDDVRENIIHYDEEGVGEEDQDAYDINRLKKPIDENPHPPNILKKPPVEERPQTQPRPYYRPPPGEQPDVGNFINRRLEDADADPTAPPHDSVREYGYEGAGSTAGSLSSLASTNSLQNEQDWDHLNGWGPRFTKLADMYGGGESEDE